MSAAQARSARRDAQALAAGLPGLLLEAGRLAAAVPGGHGRSQAGIGEAFWQYREHRPEDGARGVDWRRSARGERLYVREREREAAESLRVWIDPDPGFAWRSDPELPTKRERGLMLALAAAIVFARAGERIGPLSGASARAGLSAVEALAMALIEDQPQAPPPARGGTVVLVSDGLAPIEQWRTRFGAQSAARITLLLIADPAEEDFPFVGRTRFEPPAGAMSPITLDRPETRREAFAERVDAQRRALAALAADHGAALLAHRTDRPAGPAFSALLGALHDPRRNAP